MSQPESEPEVEPEVEPVSEPKLDIEKKKESLNAGLQKTKASFLEN